MHRIRACPGSEATQSPHHNVAVTTHFEPLSRRATAACPVAAVPVESFLTDGGVPIPGSDEETVFTAADGTYGPVEITTIPDTCPQLADGVQMTVTSPDPRLAGQTAICTQGFDKGCPTPLEPPPG